MLQSERNPLEIADAVPIRVLERSRIDLVDHFPLPPILLHNRIKLQSLPLRRLVFPPRKKAPRRETDTGQTARLGLGGVKKAR